MKTTNPTHLCVYCGRSTIRLFCRGWALYHDAQKIVGSPVVTICRKRKACQAARIIEGKYLSFDEWKDITKWANN